jgi:hypothetical protein
MVNPRLLGKVTGSGHFWVQAPKIAKPFSNFLINRTVPSIVQQKKSPRSGDFKGLSVLFWLLPRSSKCHANNPIPPFHPYG